MRFINRAPRFGVLIIAALSAASIGAGSAAAQPLSKADALAQGDPAATAPSFSESADGFVFKGKPVSAASITDRELICHAVDKGPSRCYETVDELRAAEVTPAAASARKHSGKGPIARKAECDIWAIHHAWTGRLGEGAGASFEETGRWANYGAAINNEVSSYAMGDRAGHMSELGGGGGYWYPGNTGRCFVEGNINTTMPSWNNRISSRYRIP